MRRLLAAALLALAVAPAAAQDRVRLGSGTLFTNDVLGDGRDRWRTGSFALSVVRGAGWAGKPPAAPFALTEWRVRFEVIAPARLTAAARADRRYADIIAIGLHTHFARGPVELSGGLDAVLVGPMTQLGAVQQAVHELLGHPSPAVARAQGLPNQVHPALVLEAGLPVTLGAARLRPFAEAQAGIETFARAGADIVIGAWGTGELAVRDAVTGHLYRATRAAPPSGPSFVIGGDVAHVWGSALLPGDGVARLNPTRTRLRAGFHWQGERFDLFYGITRLGREFVQQPVEQTLGSVHLRIRF